MLFYVLDSPYPVQKGEHFAETEMFRSDSVEKKVLHLCPQCGRSIGGKISIPPYAAELVLWTNGFGDIAFSCGSGEMLFTERFKRLFEESGLTGLSFQGKATIEKIKCMKGVRKKNLPVMPVYYFAYVSIGNAVVNHQLSNTLFDPGGEPTCNYCRAGLIRKIGPLVIEENSWDGTDIFVPRGIGGTTIVSEAFVRWFRENQINNGRIIPTEAYLWDQTPEALQKEWAMLENPNEDLSGDPEDNE